MDCIEWVLNTLVPIGRSRRDLVARPGGTAPARPPLVYLVRAAPGANSLRFAALKQAPDDFPALPSVALGAL
ncbi:hypothetical protein CDO44_26100 [Pigmentiphaga sp. NML080357]|nr:hypothetical protein CDO44_26100 [Pigmentiphaga sp. NML080357]